MEIKLVDFDWKDHHSIFASRKYLKSQSDNFGWVGGFIGNKLKFILPFTIDKFLIFTQLKFQNETICFGEEFSICLEKNSLNGVVKFFRNRSIDFISSPPSHVVFRAFPDDSINCRFGSHIIDLSISEYELWSQSHSKHRNVIKNATKNDVSIDRGLKNATAAFELIKRTLARSNIHFINRDSYAEFIDGMNYNAEVFIACKDGIPQGCAVLPYSSYSANYLWGGSIEKPFLGAINLLHWEAIKHFKSIGSKFYDFVGARINPKQDSRLHGIQRFKSRFGATMKEGFLWKFIYNPHKYKLFNLLRYMRNVDNEYKLDVIDQELRFERQERI